MGEAMTKLMFLGGPKDGEVIPVPNDLRRMRFPIPVTAKIESREFENAPVPMELWVYVYEKELQVNKLTKGKRLVMSYRGEERS